MATRQVIKTGTTVDDGTGDLLRDAFVKVNTNFENVWDKTSVNSNLDFTGDTVSSTGELILSPASDIKTTTNVIFNSNKGNFDFTVHGDTSDNVLFIDASTNRVGILNNAPTVALDVTGDSAISGNFTVGGLTVLNGNVMLGNAVSDIITYVGRVGSTIEPYGAVTIGTTTNRWANGYFDAIDVTGTISGTFSGSLDSSITVTNNINSTTIVGDSITATTSATVGNLLVTGTLAVQGSSVTIDSATIQIVDTLTFEGATADDFETSIVATDPTADRTITLPDASGTVALGTIPTSILDLGITDGTNGQQLTTDGSGNFSFAASGAGGGGIALTDLSVAVAAAGSSTLAYNSGTGAFTFTPPDLSTYLTSVPAQAFSSLTGTPTTVAGYGITDASSASGTETLTNKTINTSDNTITIVEADISDLGSYLTSVPAQSFASLTSKPTTIAGYGITDAFDGAYGSLTGAPTMYANSDVDTHLNQSGPTDGYVLSWTSGDYAWVANAGGGYGNSDVDTHLNTSSATTGQVLSWNGSDYAWVADTDTDTGILNVVEDTTPQLGGDLDAQAFNITTTGKLLFANVYSTTGDLPSASTYHGMFAHVHGTGKGYFAHAGNWIELANAATTLAGYGITDGYVNTDVDAHLNQSNPTSGYVLSWNGSDYAWVAQSGGGASNSISQLNSYVSVTDTGTDGKITFATEGSDRWNMSSTGHLLPEDNETYDIGSASKKVRHLYLSDSSLKFVDSSNIEYAMRVDQSTGELKYGTKTISTALQDDVKMTPDSEYQHGIKVDFTPGSGDTVFSREVEVNGVRIVAAGAKLGATAVPDLWLDKVAQAYRLFIDKDAGSPIVEATQRNFIKRLRGDHGTPHAGQPTVQRVAYGGTASYSTNFLSDAGATALGLDPFNNAHAMDDMVWYQNSSGTPGTGDLDAGEVIEHVMHTIHMKGLDAVALKMNPAVSSDWQTSDLYNAMAEAETASKWDPSGYAPNWKTDADSFPVAVKEYLYLLNFCMFEYYTLWEGSSLSPEWTDDMRTPSGIQTNNPLGYALHNTYIAPVISKPSLATIRAMFTDGDTGNPADGGPSGYVPTPLPKPVIQTTVKPATSIGVAGDKLGLTAFDGTYIYYCTANYDGSTNVWKRIAWSSDTW